VNRSVTRSSNAPVLDAEHVDFMSGAAISSAVAARSVSNQPSIAKGLAVRVRSDRRVVEVFVDADRSVALLEHVRAGSPVAVVCSEPRSHRTIQIKGQRADIEAITAGDEKFVADRVDTLVAHIVPLGYRDDPLRAYWAFAPAKLVKVVFAASAAFLQTPGPGAGAPLKT
jgi:hypothetical protein